MKSAKFFRAVSALLSLVLVFTLISTPCSIVRAESLPEVEASETVAEQVNPSTEYKSTDNEAYTELIEDRTADSKVYQLESKRYEAVKFGLPVHYLKDGSYQPIDNSLTLQENKDGSSAYVNQANSFTATFSSKLSEGQLASVEKDGYTLSWAINGLSQGIAASTSNSLTKAAWSEQAPGSQRRTSANLSSQILYSNVLPETDLELELVSDRVKENLILKQYTGLDRISQTLTVEGLELTIQEDGTIVATASSDKSKSVFWLPRPYAMDQAGEVTENIVVSIKETTVPGETRLRTYELSYALDTSWLEKASYPVKIDPTVWTSFNSKDIRDTRIVENYPTSNYYLDGFISTGEGSSSGTNYSLIKFNNLPSIGPASMIQHAGLQLYKQSTSTVTSKISVHQVTSSWLSETVTWNIQPSFNSQVEDYQEVGLPANVQYEWDITRIAKNWYTGGTNNGVLLKDMNSSSGGYKEFYSADSAYPQYVPAVYFVYTNYSGLESFWDYTSSSLGRSGTASVNLYNGNLIYTHSDVSMTGNRLPVSIVHVFNSTNKDKNDSRVRCGYGWRTNYDQRVAYVTVGGANYYKYTDEDGTEHYFQQVGGVWKDESGLDISLTVVSNVVTITDKSSNKLVFYATDDASRPGYLNYIQDRNGNQQNLYYSTNNLIWKITDGIGRGVYLDHDAAGFVTQIREPVDSTNYRTTAFSYTNSRLTQITYPDGEQTNFTYDANGNIDYVNGIANDKLDLTYSSTSPYRVTYLGESATVGGVTTDGAHAHLAYGYNRTTLEDSEGRVATYQFNDYGNTLSVTGPDGGSAYAGYGTTVTTGSMSKVLSDSKFQKFGKNCLQNHNAELTTGWSFISGTGSTGTKEYATDQKYLAAKSIKLTKTNISTYECARQTLTLEKGKTYTYSGYIKTSNISESALGALLQVTYYDASGNGVGARTSCVKGTNDWARFSTTFTIPADSTTTTAYAFALVWNSTGTAWFDCLQLEEGPVANRYNIVDNADFKYITSNIPDAWATGNCESCDIAQTSADSTNPITNDDNRFRIYGNPDLSKHLYQNLWLTGSAGDCYVAGGWAKASSASLSSGTGRDFAIYVKFDYTDPANPDEWKLVSFSEDSQIWQYACAAVVAKYDYKFMQIRVQYAKNANSADFDAIQLFKEEFGNTYEYDSNGNLTKATDAGKKAEQFQYANNDLTKYIDPSGKEFTYTYDSNHNLLTATSATGVVYTYNYDAYGNPISAKAGGSTDYVKALVSYDSNGNYTDIVTDPFGKQVNYNIDPYKGTLTSVTDPLNNTVSNAYNANTDALTQTTQTSGSTTMTNNYSYADDQLTQVSHSAPSGTVAYDFSYNSLGWSTGVKVSGAAQNLSTYSLQDRTGRLNSLTYGNGQTINYTYDSNDQLKKVSQGTTDLYAFEYDNSDNLGYQKDLVQNKEYWYEYDSLERLGKIRSKDSAGNLSWSQYGFNTANSLSTFTESILGTLYTTSFSYDNDSRPTSISFGDYSKILTYDSQNLNRTYQSVLQNSGTDIYRTQVNYVPGDGTTSTQSYRVYQVINDVGRTNETLTYSYDDRGYITKVSQDSNNYSDYRYDGFGQLIRENYKWGATSYSKVYSYDEGGNISQKVRYAFVDGDGTLGTPLETIGYGYSDSVWKDKLTSYNGSTITYDEIGNPISDGTWSYTWTQGRKLQQISKSGTTASYKYNSDGIRTEKTVNGVTTVYNVVGGQVTWEKTGSNNPIYYLYDASGELWGLKYTDNSMYFYVRNAQGDITKIVNKDGTEVVAYAYDAWGNLMSTTGSLASTLGVDNPYRYRGYRVDNETGLYYLGSRYYNPVTLRYLNVDAYVSTGQGLIGMNMFAYCNNNPIILVDPNGCRPIISDSIKNETVAERKQSFASMKNVSVDYTTQVGFSASIACVFRIESSIYYVCDNDNNWDIQLTVGGLAGTPAGGASIFGGDTNASSVNDLLGLGMDWGPSVAGFGADFIYGNNSYEGRNYSVGLDGILEIHTDITYTISLKEICFDIIDWFN